MTFGGSRSWITTIGIASVLLSGASPAFGQCKYDVAIIQAEVCGTGGAFLAKGIEHDLDREQ